MRSARHQFILLGLVCLGFSWDDYLMPGFYLVAGLVALWMARKAVLKYSPFTEPVVMVAGTAFGYLAGTLPDQSTHFAIGHGLAWIQIARLLRPLTQREKRISLIIGIFHVGVACTVVLDIRFTLILPAIVWLLPRALTEVEAETFASGVSPAIPRLNPIWFLFLAIVMLAFFVIFPRGVLATPLRSSQSGASETGSLADSIMDPTRSASSQGSRVFMQIHGENIGYLRCFSLVDTDGVQWFPSQRPQLKRLEYPSSRPLVNHPSRQVRVKNPGVLGRILPTDGRVVFVMGNFFQYPSLNSHGGIVCGMMWNTVNNVYSYWIDPTPKPEPMLRSQLRIYTNHPPQSARLRAWVEERTRGESDPYRQAKILESWFHNNCTYRLGAPVLNRLSPMDDFIFNQREGHCERFAAALALTLRMKGVPSRVVVGYVPSSRDWFSGWINVRFRDAHAWTEAWFSDRGWVQFDATPQGSGPAPSRNVSDLFDDLDFAWYAQIANFDRPTQRQLFSEVAHRLAALPAWIQSYGSLIALVLSPLLVFAAGKWLKRQISHIQLMVEPQKESMRFAGHSYGQMLQALSRRGFQRYPAQTPFEFLEALEKRSAPALDEIRTITGLFCETQYGGLLLTDEMRTQINSALAKIQRLAA